MLEVFLTCSKGRVLAKVVCLLSGLAFEVELAFVWYLFKQLTFVLKQSQFLLSRSSKAQVNQRITVK